MEKVFDTKFETNLKAIDVFKQDVLKAGFEGYNYGYPDINVVKNNEILIIASRFKSIDDNAFGGDLISIRSYDKGNTWSKPEVVQENIADRRTVAPSIVKIDELHLMLTFSAQHNNSDIGLYFKESYDGGYTWTQPTLFSGVQGYNVSNNSTVVFHNNQITVPVAYVNGDIYNNYDKSFVFLYSSNDLGKSWQFGNIIKTNFALMEPYLNYFEDGEVLVNMRTKNGKMYFARKKVQEDWVLYNSNIKSPNSPQKIYKFPNSNRLIMLWNNTSKSDRPNRSPLSMALSDDKGYSWTYIYDLETNASNDYAYSAIGSDSEYLYFSYYRKSINSNSNSSLVFARIKIEAL